MRSSKNNIIKFRNSGININKSEIHTFCSYHSVPDESANLIFLKSGFKVQMMVGSQMELHPN